MTTKNYFFSSLKELDESLDLSDIDTEKTLLQIFSGFIKELELRELRAIIKSKNSDVRYIGTTTAGEIYNGQIGSEGIAISVMEFSNTTIKSGYFLDEDELELGKKIATSLYEDKTKVMILFIDGLLTNGSNVIDGIASINNTVPIAGGMAGDNGGFSNTFVFSNEGIHNKGAVAASLQSEVLEVHTDHQLNWQPIGKEMTVTKAEGNRLYELDGVSITEIYTRYLGENIAKGLPHSAIEFPLIKNSDDGLEVCRTFVYQFEDGSMQTIGNMHEGDKVQFAFGNVNMVLENTERKTAELNRFYPEAMYTYSCTARITFMQSDVVRELEPLNRIAPIAGFFTYGEIFHSNGKHHLLNITLTILMLSERKAAQNEIFSTNKVEKVEKYNLFNDKHFLVLDALTHLTTRVIEEFEESNLSTQSNEARLRAVMDSVNEAIITIQPNGIVESANKAVESTFGYKPSEIIGKNVSIRMPESDAKEHDNYLAKYMKTKEKNILGLGSREVVALHKNGNEFHAELTVGEADIGDTKLFVGAMKDISERKYAQEELSNQKEFVQTLLDSQEQIIITTNGTQLLTANETFNDFFAVDTPEEFMDTYNARCICDTFNIQAPEGFLQIHMGEDGRESWIDYVISRSFGHTHKAMITRDGHDFVFSVTAAKLPGKDGLKSAVFTDITDMEKAKNEIERIHNHTRESIEYASLIQSALIPDNTSFRNYFQDYFAIWHPKDTVGGDIYLFEELRDSGECLLMLIDCTGHGVPGAFVTMLVKAIERQIIGKINNDHSINVSPAWILSYFNRQMKILLNQDEKDSISNAGFDGGVMYFNKKENLLTFAGAETPLFYMEDNTLKVIKGNRHSIGYKSSDSEYEFKDHVVKTKEGMSFYLTTDGYLDQNGGGKSFPLGKKRFKAIIEEYNKEPMADQQEIFLAELENYQGEEETNDDVTLVGFRV